MSAQTNKPVIPSDQELVARATAMVPALRERSAQCDDDRRVPDVSVKEMAEAGFFRTLQPKRWGGYESDPQTFFDIAVEVASGCPSTAWILGVIAVHNWQLALFPLQAQQDVWGDDDSTLISSSYMPVGKVEHTEGGYYLSGKWGFSSGCDHCSWMFLGAFIPPKDGKGSPKMHTFLLPREDYTIDDDWFVSGLRGTGSKSIVVDRAFVPSHRTHDASHSGARAPGFEHNPAPLFALPFGQLFTRTVATPAIGMLKGGLDAYLEVNSKKVSRADGKKASLDTRAQEVAGTAQYEIQVLQQQYHADYSMMMNHVRAGEEIPVNTRVQTRANSAQATERCVNALNALFAASGGGAIYDTHPINRFWQSAHAARAHYANNPFNQQRNLGGVLLGMNVQDYFI